MATEVKVPSSVLASSGGASSATTAMLTAQDASWFVASGTNVSTQVDVAMPTSTGSPTSGSNLQTISVQARKFNTNSGNPTVTISAGYVSGGSFVSVTSGSAATVTSTSGQTLTLTFDYAAIVTAGGNANGSNFAVRVATTGAGGSPSARNSADIGYIGWTVTYTPTELQPLGGTFSIAENAPAGSTIGSITGTTSGSTLSLVDNYGGRFAIAGTSLTAGTTNLNYEEATSYNVTIRETFAGYSNSPRDSTVTVTITNKVQPAATTLIASVDPVAPNVAVGTNVLEFNKTLSANMTLVSATNSSQYELYNDFADLAWKVRTTVSPLTPGAITVVVADNTNGPSGTEEERIDTFNFTVSGTVTAYPRGYAQIIS